MTTKSNICATRRAGSPCELFMDAPRRCQLITCCSNPDLPSPAQYEAAVHSPYSKCPHPEGNFWQGVAPDPLPEGERGSRNAERGTPQALNGRQLMVLQRVRCCKGDRDRERCDQHFVTIGWPWGCLAVEDSQSSNDIRPLIKDPSWACPKGLFAAVDPLLSGAEGRR